MITEAMRLAGWRECPDDATWKDWEAKGGRWQARLKVNDEPFIVTRGFDVTSHLPITVRDIPAFRPVHPSTWDYDPRGWGAVVPTEPGLWWRDDSFAPVQVGGRERLQWLGRSMVFHDPGWNPVTDDGHWFGPCIKPGVI